MPGSASTLRSGRALWRRCLPGSFRKRLAGGAAKLVTKIALLGSQLVYLSPRNRDADRRGDHSCNRNNRRSCSDRPARRWPELARNTQKLLTAGEQCADRRQIGTSIAPMPGHGPARPVPRRAPSQLWPGGFVLLLVCGFILKLAHTLFDKGDNLRSHFALGLGAGHLKAGVQALSAVDPDTKCSIKRSCL